MNLCGDGGNITTKGGLLVTGPVVFYDCKEGEGLRNTKFSYINKSQQTLPNLMHYESCTRAPHGRGAFRLSSQKRGRQIRVVGFESII